MLILAGNHSEANTYSKSAHYLRCTDDIRGFKSTTLLLVGSWIDRDDIDIGTIEEYCKSHNITIAVPYYFYNPKCSGELKLAYRNYRDSVGKEGKGK